MQPIGHEIAGDENLRRIRRLDDDLFWRSRRQARRSGGLARTFFWLRRDDDALRIGLFLLPAEQALTLLSQSAAKQQLQEVRPLLALALLFLLFLLGERNQAGAGLLLRQPGGQKGQGKK